ncbi:MAG TPA: hypothetical protein VEP90_11565, partial [Methylomirabilota bacterium]|nr:hypothetical protein [Methylomirabilota bacterium]
AEDIDSPDLRPTGYDPFRAAPISTCISKTTESSSPTDLESILLIFGIQKVKLVAWRPSAQVVQSFCRPWPPSVPIARNTTTTPVS